MGAVLPSANLQPDCGSLVFMMPNLKVSFQLPFVDDAARWSKLTRRAESGLTTVRQGCRSNPGEAAVRVDCGEKPAGSAGKGVSSLTELQHRGRGEWSFMRPQQPTCRPARAAEMQP